MLSMLRMASEWQLHEPEAQMDMWTALRRCAGEPILAQAAAMWGAPALSEARSLMAGIIAESAASCDQDAFREARLMAIQSLQGALSP